MHPFQPRVNNDVAVYALVAAKCEPAEWPAHSCAICARYPLAHKKRKKTDLVEYAS